MPDSDSDSDSDPDSKPNGYIALYKSFHTVQSQIQIPFLTVNYRNGIGIWVRTRLCIVQCKSSHKRNQDQDRNQNNREQMVTTQSSMPNVLPFFPTHSFSVFAIVSDRVQCEYTFTDNEHLTIPSIFLYIKP